MALQNNHRCSGGHGEQSYGAILERNPGETLGEQSRTAILEVDPSWETLKAILKGNIGKELWRAILKDNLLGGGGNPGRRS